MNPELRRLLWLQVSLQRLILLPAAIFGSALLLHQSEAPTELMRTLAMGGFFIVTLVWGAREAANSVLDEARDRTWEIQRMSALPAWTMTWGKLAGATAIPWYGGACCLAIFIYTDPATGSYPASAWAGFAVCLAIAAHGLALASGLVGLQQHRARQRLNIVLLIFLLSLLLPELTALTLPGVGPLRDIGGVVQWYGRAFHGLGFNLCLLSMLAVWGVVAAYRMMCLELEVRTSPWVWLLFIVFLAVLVAGFGSHTPDLGWVQQLCSIAAASAATLTYIAGFAFYRDPVQYRRVLHALRELRWRRALEEMPLWISSAAMTLVFAVAASVLGADPGVDNARLDNLGAVALALALFMIRDLALLVLVSFGQRTRRSEVLTLLYIALLNRVIPGLLTLLNLDALASILHPPIFDRAGFAILIAASHAAIAVILASLAYRASMRQPASTAPGPAVN